MIRYWDSRKKGRCPESHKTTVTAGDAAEMNEKSISSVLLWGTGGTCRTQEIKPLFVNVTHLGRLKLKRLTTAS